ncbi:hemolysin family protein [Pseudonocardia sp.]|uniref:hemolysin family protein n=1 Tax=Pseudonocardia sp. TaxID=60912 RepID=UPI003D146CB3
MNTWTIVVSIALIAASAFFVAIEFALVAARRYRLEEAAERSASARAALRSARDLSLLLAGSQLGITLCTLGLGAIAKPAVDEALEPVLTGWGLPAATAGVLAFVLSLIVVTFLHLVVGEMAPKSWAIAHPARSATLLAPPMRGFMWLTRPVLLVLNGLANRCLRADGVDPVDELGAGRDPADLRELVTHSARAGALDEDRRAQIVTALDIYRTPLRELMHAGLVTVATGDTAARVRAASRESGHLRLVVLDGDVPVGVVHVRDALAAPAGATAGTLMRPVLTLSGDETAHAALGTMREKRAHLALVSVDGTLGLVTMRDIVDRLFPAEPATTG